MGFSWGPVISLNQSIDNHFIKIRILQDITFPDRHRRCANTHIHTCFLCPFKGNYVLQDRQESSVQITCYNESDSGVRVWFYITCLRTQSAHRRGWVTDVNIKVAKLKPEVPKLRWVRSPLLSKEKRCVVVVDWERWAQHRPAPLLSLMSTDLLWSPQPPLSQQKMWADTTEFHKAQLAGFVMQAYYSSVPVSALQE